MLPDLERLIRLQELDTETELRRKWSTDLPGILPLSINASPIGKPRSMPRGSSRPRISTPGARSRRILPWSRAGSTKFKDQLMEVKTNKEYLAMQHEIATAQDGVRGFEDQILELMVKADELAAAVKQAEGALKQEQTAAASERTQLEARQRRTEVELAELASARAGVEREMPSRARRALQRRVGRNATGRRWSKHVTATARHATSACARSSTTSCGAATSSTSARAARASLYYVTPSAAAQA